MHLYALPHHDGSALYCPPLDRSSTSSALGQKQTVRVRVPGEFGALSSAAVRVVIDAEPQFAEMRMISSPLPADSAQWWEGVIGLDNPVVSYRFLLNRADGSAWWLNGEGVDSVETVDALDFRATIYPTAPDWAARRPIYQVFPDRFARSQPDRENAGPGWAVAAGWNDAVIHEGPLTTRQLFGGDFDGAIEHLDHIEALGVGLLYLTPFFPAGSNHRYDASSFDRVDPLLGGDDALIRFVTAAHARGIRVIGDLTTNHTGDAHEWFRSALGDPSAAESDFYYWLDDRNSDYVSWYGVPSLPKLNWKSHRLRRRLIEGRDSIVAKWLLPPFQLDGWRIDVANMTGRHGTDDLNRDIQQTVRRTMDEFAPGSILFAESTNDAARDFDGSGWQAPMSYSAFTRPLWHWLRIPETDPQHHFGIPYGHTPHATADAFVRSNMRFTAAYPWAVRMLSMNAIDTHDTPRFAERANDDVQLVAAGLSFTLPGAPVVYAGDEFGLRGKDGEDSRKPIPWSTTPRLLESYAQLSALRLGSAAIERGSLRWLFADDESLAFVRETPDTANLVVAFRSAATISLPIGQTGRPGATAALTFGDVTLAGVEAIRISSAGPAFGVWTLDRPAR
jgi:alpha-glucosidase